MACNTQEPITEATVFHIDIPLPQIISAKITPKSSSWEVASLGMHKSMVDSQHIYHETMHTKKFNATFYSYDQVAASAGILSSSTGNGIGDFYLVTRGPIKIAINDTKTKNGARSSATFFVNCSGTSKDCFSVWDRS